MSSVVKSTHTEEPPKVKRKTLSVASLSHLRQSSRNVIGDCSADDDHRPSWLDAYEEPLEERFIFTLKDDEAQKKANKKKAKRSAILSPRALNKENLSASLHNSTSSLSASLDTPSTPSSSSLSSASSSASSPFSSSPAAGEGDASSAKPRRKHSRSLLLRSKRARDDIISVPASCLDHSLPPSAPADPAPFISFLAPPLPVPLPIASRLPDEPLPPPPDADSPPRPHHQAAEPDVAPPPPPLPPRDYDPDYVLRGSGRGRSRTYAHPAELRKAGFASASFSTALVAPPPLLIPPHAIPLRPPTGVPGTRSMYELSSSPERNGLAHSQPVKLNRSYQHQLERRHAAGDAKELKRLEKMEKKQRKKMEKQLKKEEKKQSKQEGKQQTKKREKKEKKQSRKDKMATEADVDSPFFVDSCSTPSFNETRAQLLL